MTRTLSPTTLAGAPALALTLILAAACGPRADHAPPREAAPVAVPVAAAALQAIPRPIVLSGGVEPVARVEPGTKILGRITAVLVEEGEPVRRGQVLARLDSRDLEAAVAQAEAAVAMAEAQLENAAIQARRMAELHSRGSVTDKNLEDSVAAHRVAQAAVAQAEANLAAARVQLGYAVVTSPIAGWVVAQRVEAGDMAAPGRPFFVIEDLSTVEVTVQAAEDDVVSLQTGDPATVAIGGLAGELQAGIHRIVPAGDPASRTFSIKLRLDNPDGKIKSGMFARASFAGEVREQLLVPSAALVERGQLLGLFVVADGRARLRWVRTGDRVGDGVEISSGLEPGEIYVTAPPPGLTDGAPVTGEPAS